MFNMHLCVLFLGCCSSPAIILMLNLNIVCFSVLYDCTSISLFFYSLTSHEHCHNVNSFEHSWHIHFSRLQDEGTPILKCQPDCDVNIITEGLCCKKFA